MKPLAAGNTINHPWQPQQHQKHTIKYITNSIDPCLIQHTWWIIQHQSQHCSCRSSGATGTRASAAAILTNIFLTLMLHLMVFYGSQILSKLHWLTPERHSTIYFKQKSSITLHTLSNKLMKYLCVNIIIINKIHANMAPNCTKAAAIYITNPVNALVTQNQQSLLLGVMQYNHITEVLCRTLAWSLPIGRAMGPNHYCFADKGTWFSCLQKHNYLRFSPDFPFNGYDKFIDRSTEDMKVQCINNGIMSLWPKLIQVMTYLNIMANRSPHSKCNFSNIVIP